MTLGSCRNSLDSSSVSLYWEKASAYRFPTSGILCLKARQGKREFLPKDWQEGYFKCSVTCQTICPLGTGWQERPGRCWQQQVLVGTGRHHEIQAGDEQSLHPKLRGLSVPGNYKCGFLSSRDNTEGSLPRGLGVSLWM